MIVSPADRPASAPGLRIDHTVEHVTTFGHARSPDRSAWSLLETVVISLTTATARRKAMTSMLESSGISWSYFDAHTMLQCHEMQYNDAAARKRFGRALSMQEIAVCSSHFAVLRDFLERGRSDYVLVLEDDLIIDTGFPLEEFCKFCADRKLEYVRLFGKHYAKAARLGFFYDRSITRYMSSPAGAQAYLVSRSAAAILMRQLRVITETFDLAMDRFWETGLPLYAIFPYPVIERYSPTSIPIPTEGNRLNGIERLSWNYSRATSKIKKIRANWKLSGLDKQMKREMPAFHQIVPQ